MPEPTFPQLRSLSLSAQGRLLSLRVLLPPNFAAIASRGGKVPVKIEASIPNEILPPERLPQETWSVEPGTFLAGLLIESWCNGRIPSMLQLDAAQLCQLLQPLENTASVFWLKAPQQPIRWLGGELEGVHEHLRDSAAANSGRHGRAGTENRNTASASKATNASNKSAATSSGRSGNTNANAANRQSASFADCAPHNPFGSEQALPQMESDLTPLEVDGSVQFLALRLPSRESALYPHALALVKDNGFQLEPSNAKWWLRDRHKTLQFLADYTHDLRTQYKARFTENFTERTSSLRFARLEVNVTSSVPRGGDAFELELALSAPGLNEAMLQQALEKGQFYIEAEAHNRSAMPRQQTQGQRAGEQHSNANGASGQQPQSAYILVPRHVRQQAERTQQALGADVTRGLRSHFRSRIRREEVAVTQTVLQELGSALAADALAENPLATNPLATDAHTAGIPRQGGRPHSAQENTRSRSAAQPTRQRQQTRDTAGFGSEMEEPVSLATKLPAQWMELGRALNNLSALTPCPMPDALAQSLRPYQRIGAAWLWHLYRSGLGGILADEMGLGKTVQFLAFIAAANTAAQQTANAHPANTRTAARTIVPRGHSNTPASAAPATARDNTAADARQPSLVVCPASLVDNWRREATKFTPWLKVFCHHGESRLTNAADAAHYDLIITSYGTLARDQQLFESIEFLIAAGDEAQHIKNAKTQNARAMRGLRASGRFLMTGTPVENDIRELQSLFGFILPGYLTPPTNKARAGANAQDAASAKESEREWLVTRAAPYILRRMKRTVASDLPEKIEQVLYCELGARQRAFYRDVQEAARRAVMELELGGAADNRVRFAAFTELLRLRQVCIDPRLLDATAQADSAKRETLLELVQEAVEGGHRMLIFSQFTSALQLVAEDLNELGLRHFYLDGQTRNRAALCEEFNADESVKAFLISLRAGGTGLNLTGADTVIHLDPWWNPAAQAQASDRAHRIGQQKVVTVYQLIAAQTVEEQVLTLQRQKTALLEQLLDASDASSTHIGIDDLKALIG